MGMEGVHNTASKNLSQVPRSQIADWFRIPKSIFMGRQIS
jgi:hypothetical protein